MPGLGVIVNVAAVIVGSVIGTLAGRALPQRLHKGVVQAMGLATLAIGAVNAVPALTKLNAADGAIGRFALLIFVGSLIIGAFVGEAFCIECHLENFGDFLKRKFVKSGTGDTSADAADGRALVEAFMTATLIYCVGAMTVIGSIQDGLGNPGILYVKALLDGTISLFLASTLGYGIALSAIPVLILQGAIALLAFFAGNIIPDIAITAIEAVGGTLIIGIGVNLALDTKLRLGNMLPAVFIAMAAVWILA
ncbi:MAG: DUF554 domain-containing protein [Actinomycetes bacterium]|jgi:uncharacterized membrane protein YqgA involved in biofilm formation|nr:DUF554 domain-containing protein [Actinomycetes bacterium]